MKLSSYVRCVIWVLLIALPEFCGASDTPAGEPSLPLNVAPNSELFVLESSGRMSTGRYVRADERSILLLSFDAKEARFQVQAIDLMGVSEIKRVERRRSAAYPMLGGLILGCVGAAVGYTLGESDTGSGDVLGTDTRPWAAFGLGLAGAFVGFAGGAIVAPEHLSEHTVWSRN